MLNDETNTAGAADVRARVQDALKSNVQRELLAPFRMAGFSNVSHVVSPTIDLENQNQADAELLGISDIDEDKFQMFIERLTEHGLKS